MASNVDMQIESVDHVYARALLELAEAAGQRDVIFDEVQQLLSAEAGGPALARLLESPMIATRQKLQLVTTILQGRINELLLRFTLVLTRRGRLHRFRGILRAFVLLVEARHGAVEVEAHVAQELPAEQAQAMTSRLGQIIKRQVVLRQYVEPELVGGLKVRVGDRVYDGSVATQLRLMRERMTESGREKARQAAAD